MSYDEILSQGREMNAHAAIDPARTALLVIDMQNGFALAESPFGKAEVRALIPAINQLAGIVRAAGGHIVWTRHGYADEAPFALQPWQTEAPIFRALAERFRPGSRDHDVLDAMDVRSEDDVIDKFRYSALTRNSSNLEELLVARDVEAVIIVGCASNCCCESTARDAYALGFKVFVPEDGNAAASEEERRAALLNISRVCADIRPIASLTALITAA
jgi:ureidoacrylate peracid hydrolase